MPARAPTHMPYAATPGQVADYLGGFSDFVTREETRTALLAAIAELRLEPSGESPPAPPAVDHSHDNNRRRPSRERKT